MQKSSDQLYEKYGIPLEKDHWGEFLAVSESGKTVLGKNLIKVAKKALANFGSGSHLYKIGDIAVYKWRKITK